MNGSLVANEQRLKQLLDFSGFGHTAVAVCPPSAYLAQAQKLLSGSGIGLGGQDVSEFASGAYTGQCSAGMLVEFGCEYAIVGHSERREYQGESSAQVAQKALAALSQKLVPVICVGETLAQREAGQTLVVIGEQITAITDALSQDQLRDSVIAYEPVWAIGTGLTATPEQAQEVHAAIRAQLGSVGENIQILYGGSVKPGNAVELFAMADIDGALVGGAALVAEDFAAIAKAANT